VCCFFPELDAAVRETALQKLLLQKGNVKTYEGVEVLEVSGQLHASAALPQERAPVIHFI
jgi:hypothetical protein